MANRGPTKLAKPLFALGSLCVLSWDVQAQAPPHSHLAREKAIISAMRAPAGVRVEHGLSLTPLSLERRKNPTRAQAVLVGGLGGAIVGAVIGAATCEKRECKPATPLFVGAALGSVAGALAGAAVPLTKPIHSGRP